MALFKFVAWLAYWYSKTNSFEFEWDGANTTKITSKHSVELGEVESVFEMKLGVPLGAQIRPVVSEVRYCLVGPSIGGRMLSIVFTFRNHRIRTVSARPASRKERKAYEEIRQATQEL